MLRIGKQTFRWRWMDEAGGFSRTTLPGAARLPDQTNVVSVDFTLGKLRDAGKKCDSIKYACPLFSFREESTKTQGQRNTYVQGVLADFDVLPEGYESFAELRAELARRFPDACVFPTPTGKAKVCWFVLSYRQSITDAQAVAFLDERIPDLIDCIDTSSAALSVAFLDAQAIQVFLRFDSLWADDDSYIQELPGKAQGFASQNEAPESKHRYAAVSMDKLSPRLLELLTFATMGMTDKQRVAFTKLMCVLSACPAMLSDAGMGLSTVILSKQLDVTPPTVSKWLKLLCDAGLIKWTGNKTCAGVKAKHYVAKHTALVESIERNVVATKNRVVASVAEGMASAGVIPSMLQRYGNGHGFRQRVTYWAAASGMELPALMELINTYEPGYFATKQERRRELRACYVGAQKKFKTA